MTLLLLRWKDLLDDVMYRCDMERSHPYGLVCNTAHHRGRNGLRRNKKIDVYLHQTDQELISHIWSVLDRDLLVVSREKM